MKTITNEIKAKYFAQYYNQMYESDGYYYCLTGERLDNILCGERGVLQLNSLEKISDEDIDEIVRICPELQMNDYENLKRIILNDLILDCLKPSKYYKIYQYLQSKGYALPYLDYSVNDLITLNVIKLK